MCSEPNKDILERSIEEISGEAIRIREEGVREPSIREISAKEKIIFSVAAVKIEKEGEDGLKTHIQLVTMQPETREEDVKRKIREKIKKAPCISEIITHFTNN